LDTPGPRNLRDLELPTPTPTPAPLIAPAAPGSPLGLVPVPNHASLDCDYLRQNQETVPGYLKFDFVGTDGSDVIEGTDGPDVIDGGGGNDTIHGKGGNDIICGGPGFDTLHGEEGDDALFGEADRDVLLGGAGQDTLIGGLGNDGRAEGPWNGEWQGLYGGPGDDWLYGGEGKDWLEGGPGNDTLFGGLGTDDLYGDDFIGNDEPTCPIVTGAENNQDPCRDWLFGGFGDDFLFGGPDNDSINGDIVPPQFMKNTGPYTPYPPDWIKYLDLYEGSKQIQKGAPLPEFGSDILHGNWGNDWMYDPGSTAGIQKNNFYGGEGDDVLIGGENTDFIWGGPGDDEAWGNAGEGDQLYGDDYGDPNDNYDKLYGGEGKDFLSVADVMLGGPNPPGDPDSCKDNYTQFKIGCDDED